MLKASRGTACRVLGFSFSLIGVMFEWYYLAYNWTGGALGLPWYRDAQFNLLQLQTCWNPLACSGLLVHLLGFRSVRYTLRVTS
jgi:hypothetical protein